MGKESNRGITVIQIIGDSDDNDDGNILIDRKKVANASEADKIAPTPPANFPTEQLQIVEITEKRK